MKKEMTEKEQEDWLIETLTVVFGLVVLAIIVYAVFLK